MRQLAVIIYGLILSVAIFSTASAGEIWRITSLDWQPYSDSKAMSQGNAIQKLRLLLKEEGIELVVEFYPWARAQEIARQSGYVGYFPAWPEEVGEGFISSLPVSWSEIGVLTYVGSGLEWEGLDELFQSKVGLISNYVYPEAIVQQAHNAAETVDPTPNEMALLRKLSAGRIRAAITDPTVIFYLAEEEGIDNIKVLKVLSRSALVMAFKDSLENKERMRVLNMLLKE